MYNNILSVYIYLAACILLFGVLVYHVLRTAPQQLHFSYYMAPFNVILDRYGSIYITSFGFAYYCAILSLLMRLYGAKYAYR